MDKSNIFIKSVQYVDKDGNPLCEKQYINKTLDEWQKEIDEEMDRIFTHETTDLDRYRCCIESDPWYYGKEEDKIIAQGRNYKITQKYSEYTDDNGITMVYPSIAKSILNKDKGE